MANYLRFKQSLGWATVSTLGAGHLAGLLALLALMAWPKLADHAFARIAAVDSGKTRGEPPGSGRNRTPNLDCTRSHDALQR